MANIQNELNNIKNAVFGKDVRDSIHDAIKTCYDDASVNDNANMEVKLARGVYKTLNERLNESDKKQEEISSQLEHKANKNDIAKISSGTPLFASSVIGMTDTSRNYVNTSDGYLYTYNGTEFEKSNMLYQSLGINDNSIYKTKLENKISENFEENFSVLDVSLIYEKYIKRQDASIVETPNYSKYSYGELFVSEGEKIRFSGIAYYDMAVIIIVDRENNVLKTFPDYSPSGEFNVVNEYITIPSNAYKMYVNNYNGRTIIEKVSNYDLKLQSYLLGDFKKSYKEIDLTFEDGSYYLPSKGETIQTGGGDLYSCAINKIKACKGEKYKFSGFSRYLCYSILITDIKGNVISKYPTEHDTSVKDYYVEDYEFDIPENGIYILVNSSISTRTTLFKEYGYKIKTSDKFDNKNIVFDGDSITYGAGVADHTKGILPNKNMGWVYDFQQRHKNSKCYGFAQSGWRIARKQEDSISLLQHIPSYPSAVDYFVLSGGYNDQAQNIPLGTISDKYYNCDFDEYTFTGALESYFRQIVQLYPYAKKLYILTPKKIYSDSAKTERFNKYWERIREVCDKWAIPILDLSRVGGIVGTDTHEIIEGVNIDDLMFADTLGTGHGDYVHPNQDFYTYHLNDKVDSFINLL